jgi:hypothetical protein
MTAWSFVGANGLSSHIASLGFRSHLTIRNTLDSLAVDGDFDLVSPGYSTTQAFVCPPLQAGLVCFHFVGECTGAIVPGNFTASYGGRAATIEAQTVQNVTTNVVEVIGYVYVGDSSELVNNNFVLAVTGIGGAATVQGSIQFAFAEGIADTAEHPGVFYWAGTLNTFTAQLEVDVDVGLAFTFAGAAAADNGTAPVLTVTTARYAQAVAQVGTTGSTQAIATLLCDTVYNCDCEVDPAAKTLLELRTRLLRRAGYASQATSPPPGIADLFNDYLYGAQEYLYRRYKPLQTRRFFSWNLEPGIRYYGFGDNLQCCSVGLDRSKVLGAWIQDPNNTWWPLIYGIDPSFYTLDQQFGWPNYYELRQCIEVFPPPSGTGYKLWLKGDFRLLPFTADADVTTIDAEPIFLWALGLAKSHKGDRDAGSATPGGETGYYGMAVRYIKDLIAAKHVNQRYIPGAAAAPIPTPPRMVQFDN